MKTPEELAEEYAQAYIESDSYLCSKYSFFAGYQAAQDQMNSSNNSNGWISVKDRLPKPKEGNVLVLISGNGWHDYDVAYFGRTVFCDKYDDTVEGVTHWMPLPKPPKEEK